MKINKFSHRRRSFLFQLCKIGVASFSFGLNDVLAVDVPGAPGNSGTKMSDIDERQYNLWLQEVQMAAEQLAADSGTENAKIDVNDLEKSTKKTFEKNGYNILPPKAPILFDVQ